MSSDHLPLPPKSFDVPPLIKLWTRPIIRIHDSRFDANEFNPGRGEGGRFDPLHDDGGAIVPTLYGASSLGGAIAETVFRKVPVRGRRRLADLALKALQASTIQSRRPLRLIDLRGFGLPRLGVSRQELIESTAEQYPATRAWAVALYRAVEDADGLIWVARQHDVSQSILLFGTRVQQGDLEVVAAPRPLAPAGRIDRAVSNAAKAAGILIVPT